jgi:Zn-dependent membrane protease YugP
MFYFDPWYFIWIAPALLLAFIAQGMVSSAYARASQIRARLSGMAAARRILDSAGLENVDIEQVPGKLTDHYDPRHKVLRLSEEVYHGTSMAAVGIAAHEAGHAIQDAVHYAPLVIRNLAVPVANFGSSLGMIVFFIGLALALQPVAIIGLVLFAGVAFFQIVNLPVEFDASARAKQLLVSEGIIDQHELPEVKRVLNAAALTYVAATLQSVLTLLYYVSLFMGRQRRESRY